VNATASSLASSSVPSPDSEVKLEDEMTRFKMWCGNLGAHQTGPPSLDHRLREAPHLHDQVIRLLRDLTESLDNVLSVVDPANHPQDNPDATTEAFPSEDSESFPEGLDDTDSEDSFSETSSTSPISTLYDDIKVPVDCLLRLSVAIANPAPHERHRKLGAGKEADVTFREKFDVDYVKDKFPGIAPDLAEALGKSITRRRQFFKYREAHHTRLAEGLETTTPNIAVQEGNQTHDDTGRTEIVPQTVASSLPGHLRSLTEVDPRAGIIDEDLRSDTGISQTSYATSAGFIQDMLSGQTPPPPLRVPPLPAAAESGVFECPLCYRMITASSPSACATSLETFALTLVCFQSVSRLTQTLTVAIAGRPMSHSFIGDHGDVRSCVTRTHSLPKPLSRNILDANTCRMRLMSSSRPSQHMERGRLLLIRLTHAQFATIHCPGRSSISNMSVDISSR